MPLHLPDFHHSMNHRILAGDGVRVVVNCFIAFCRITKVTTAIVAAAPRVPNIIPKAPIIVKSRSFANPQLTEKTASGPSLPDGY